jgi:hypothetical protein
MLIVFYTLHEVKLPFQMKKAIALAGLVILFQSALKCQEINLEILKADSLIKGVYMTFEEFQQNNPSLRVNFGSMYHDQIRNKINNGTSVFDLYIEDTSKTYIKIRQRHWGLCDGKRVFILYYGNYYQLSLDGKYCQFSESQTSLVIPMQMNVNFIFNAAENRIKDFTKDNVAAILKTENKDLYNEFKADKDKGLMMYDYLNRLNKTYIYK